MIGGEVMADTDVGKLTASVSLDTKGLEQGVNQAEKSLNKLDSSFLKSQQNISGAIRNLSSSMNKNSEQIHRSSVYIKDSITNQTRVLLDNLKKVNSGIKESNRNTVKATQAMSSTMVQEIKHINKQFDLMFAFMQRDFAKGIKKLAKEVRNSSPQVTGGLKNIQAQAERTSNSLGKLSKLNKIESKFINLGTDRIQLPQATTPKVNIAQDLSNATAQANSLTSSLMQTWHTLSMISFQVYLFQQGLQQVSNLVQTFVAPGWEFAKAMETNEVGMAGILSSMTQLEERELAWNEAMDISKSIIQELNVEAVKTAATTEELVGTFRALLGPGLGADFSLDEIKEFTVIGVNAVKSMGLEGRQLVQELRDLVQGGIQSASSTLATALGLTDKDIKDAKNSSEGLFKFLMNRLRGFKYSADATAETIKGLESIVAEGYTLASAEALQPIMNEYRDMLKSIQDIMFDENSFTIDYQFVSGFKEVADYSLKFLENIKDIVVFFKPLGKVLVDTIVPALKAVAEYSDVIVALWGSMYLGQKLGSVAGISSEWKNAVASQVAVSEAVKASNQQYNQLMQTALDTGKVIAEQHNKEQRASAQRKETASIVNKLKSAESDEIKQLGEDVAGLHKRYTDLGLSSQEASQLQYDGAKLAEKGGKQLLDTFIETTTARINDAKEAKKHTDLINKEAEAQQILANRCAVVANGIQNIGIAVSGAGLILGAFADEENKTAQEMANMAVQGGVLLTAFSGIVQAIPTLVGSLKSLGKTLETLNATMALTKLLSTTIGTGLGIGLGVGAATVGAYALATDTSAYELEQRWDDAWDNGQERQKRLEQNRLNDLDMVDKSYQETMKKRRENTYNLTPKNSKLDETQQGHIRSEYKKLEQELKTALTPLKELQKEYDHIYKYDLMSTQSYVESKFNLQRQAIDIEIENLEERKAVAKQLGQMADVDNFNTQIERLGVEKENLKREAVRQLVDEYKKLDDRLFNIKKEFEGLVGVSEKAFEENLIREYGATIVRITQELETANAQLDRATKTNNSSEMELWETRKKSYQDAQERLNRIISLKKLEFDATKALANAEKINLEIQDKFIAIQREADNGNISSLNAESQLYEMRKERLDEYIDAYATAIARYEQMAQAELAVGNIEGFNNFKQKAIEAKQALDEVANAIHPLQRVIKEEFAGSLSEAFQSMLWGEKTAKEALKDFANAIMQTFTKQVFDNFSKQIASVIFPQGNLDIETAVQSKVNVDLTAFNQNITQGAQTFQEGLVYSVTRLNEFNNAIYQATQAMLAQQAGAQGGSTNKWGQWANAAISASGIANGGEGSSSLAGVGQALSGLSFAIGGMNFSENQLGGLGDLSEDASDASISLGSLTKSLGSSTSATDDNAKATGSNVLAIGTMITSLLSASGSLGKFGTVLQGLMMAMQIAQATGILGFADGGYISGPGTGTSDSIPARLSNGEYVVRAGAVKQLGVGFLDQLNNIDRSGVKRSSRLPKFAYAEGGYVNAEMGGETQSSTPSVTGGVAQPTVVMQMTFQSLDPEANMKLMEAQYPQIRSRLIRDLQSNSSVRTAVKGVTK